EHQDYPFEELVDQLNLPRETGRNPLFDVMFIMQNMDDSGLHTDDAKFTTYEMIRNIAKLDLSLEVIEEAEELELHFEYKTCLFDKQTIETVMNHFNELLDQIAQNNQVMLKDIELTSKVKKRKSIKLDLMDFMV
ncbi:condensation domain-containing protein, partial [Paenibacillus sp. ISL-20]|uniref:condensation domain-containing protein n=1 Tax=Paenibacillus sp. ISL-20 TaxID=2819163 RepID=UPI001BE68625